MGYLFADQFSLLHFATGVIAYFWNFSLLIAFLLHFLFEIVENTPQGMRFIRTYFTNTGLFDWPGGKDKPDSILNIIGDNVFFILGWILSYYADYYGRKYDFYYEGSLNKFK
jgi:hypothetical protein